MSTDDMSTDDMSTDDMSTDDMSQSEALARWERGSPAELGTGSDVVRRLRVNAVIADNEPGGMLVGSGAVFGEAADEIGRLRQEIVEMELAIPLLIDGARKPLMRVVERLREICSAQADEIGAEREEAQRLRDLITEWVRCSEDSREETLADYDSAWTALRKAVGR